MLARPHVPIDFASIYLRHKPPARDGSNAAASKAHHYPMAPPPKKKPWPAGVIVAESILELVAELRYYLGGENYTSGRYAGTHAMLFSVEHHLRALDLDGDGMLVRGDEIISLRPSEVMCDLYVAMERLSELVEGMKAAAEAFGARGGCAIDAQLAVALWLGARGRDRLLRLELVLRNLSDVCYHGKHVLDDDNARREVAELQRLDRQRAAAALQAPSSA